MKRPTLGRGRSSLRRRAPLFRAATTAVTVVTLGLFSTVLLGAKGASAETSIPAWQKAEPLSYDISPTPPDKAARLATPQDTTLSALNGEVVVSWWMLKDPNNPRHSILLPEWELMWPQPRQVGQGGPVVFAPLDETNSDTPAFPLLNGIVTLLGDPALSGLSASPGWAIADGKPGIRSTSYSVDYLADSNTWQARGQTPLAQVNFTADHPVAGSYYHIPVDGNGTEPTNVDAVINSHITGSVTLNGHYYDVTNWRGEYWRMNIFPSVINSQLNPATAWRGWEWTDTMEPDGGSSQFYGIINPQGQYSGMLIDARPTGARICSKTTLKFGDYHYGTAAWGDISPPFRPHTIPGWVTVTCGPNEPVQMSKTFYPDSTSYADTGLVDLTEMPIHTVPGSFGSYEHERYTNYRLPLYLQSVGVSAMFSKLGIH